MEPDGRDILSSTRNRLKKITVIQKHFDDPVRLKTCKIGDATLHMEND